MNICDVDNLILSISCVYVFYIHKIDKNMYISNMESLSISNIDINVLFIPHVENFSIPYMDKMVFGYMW